MYLYIIILKDMTTAQRLTQKLETARRINNTLASEILADGGGATGIKATMFVNAGKDLMKAEREVRNAYNNGKITIEEYKTIIAA